MRNTKKSQKDKGSVLVAIIGVLAVFSCIAIRFNIDMENSMLKIQSKVIATDVKVIAQSGLMYCIAGLLKNGKYYSEKDSNNYSNLNSQLAIEEELECLNGSNNSFANEKQKKRVIGNGAPEFGAIKFNAGRFWNEDNSNDSLRYIPEKLLLDNSKVSFLVEDLSAKLPIGHVSQLYQRHLISTVLVKLLTNKTPMLKGLDRHGFQEIDSELFEDKNFEENSYDKIKDHIINLRSLLPFEMAKKRYKNSDSLNVAGLPIADGLITNEELGSSYTWVKYNIKESEKKHANDFPRPANDYLLLNSALTPFTRFIHETKFTDKSTNLEKSSPVSYASLNPMVMYHQNERLYYAFLNYCAEDPKLKLCYSVSFDPKENSTGIYATDDIDSQIAAFVDEDFFKNRSDSCIITTPMVQTYLATSSNIVYNARGDQNDLHEILKPPFIHSPIEPEKTRCWGDAEFLWYPDKDNAYYVVMDKSVKRLARAFKGTATSNYPAENTMCPIMTRKTLEFAILKAVFGESLLFVIDNQLVGDGGKIDYFKLLNALQNNKIDLSKIKFVENALSKYLESEVMNQYFVPYWNNYDEYTKCSIKFFPPDEQGKDIEVPYFGLYFNGTDYINYLPHPQTNQSGLHQTYVTIATLFSEKYKNEVDESSSGSSMKIRKLYINEVNEDGAAAMNFAGNLEAYLDLSTNPPYKIFETKITPNDNYVKLFYTKKEAVNFKPANFAPFETKIRIAVLVNLLNAIIPSFITPTKNCPGDSNSSLFSINAAETNFNLKDFIYFKDGQYWVNNKTNNGLPAYLKGWTGGIRTPGMTFWKYGVHSTTFQLTVDAFKYDEAARLSAVVTFDSYDDSFNIDNSYDNLNPEINNKHSKSKYVLTENVKKNPNVFSTIYLNPKGRLLKDADNYVIGNGYCRYPTPSNTDSWKFLNFVWSEPFAKNSIYSNDYFMPIHLYPEDVLNNGEKEKNWHFEQISNSESFNVNKFFIDSKGIAKLNFIRNEKDYSKGIPSQRNYSFGKNSWIQWKAFFSAPINANELEIQIIREPCDTDSKYIMDHKLTILNKNKPNVGITVLFSTSANDAPLITEKINLNLNPDVLLPAGEYLIRLTELKDSYPAFRNEERITKIIFNKKHIE